MIFQNFIDIKAYFEIQRIEHTKLERSFKYVSYPLHVHFGYEESAYNHITGNITIQSQSKIDFLHEVTHKSVIQEFGHSYPYKKNAYETNHDIIFLKSIQKILCKFSIMLQEKCLNKCNVESNIREELNSNIYHIHSSLHKNVSANTCLLAIGEYGNRLYETNYYFHNKYYPLIFLTSLDLIIARMKDHMPALNFNDTKSIEAVYRTFNLLEELSDEEFKEYMDAASARYVPVFESINELPYLSSIYSMSSTIPTGVLLKEVVKRIPNISLTNKYFNGLWETHLSKIKYLKVKNFAEKFSMNVINNKCHITEESDISKIIAANTNSADCKLSAQFIGSLTDILHRDFEMVKMEILPRAIGTMIKKATYTEASIYDESYESNCELKVFSPVIDYYTSLN